MAHHLITAVVSVLPAVLAYWWGRRLDQTTDDAVAFERRAANSARNSFVGALCVALMFTSNRSDWMWGLPLLAVTKMTVGYRLRKRLFNETWSILGYASFFARLWIAAFGFWILLSFSPWLVSQAGNRSWMAAAALASVLIALNEGYGRVFRWVLRARRVDNPAITSRFDLMVNACALRNVSRMLLSPAGRFVAIADESDDDEITTFHAGATGGPLTTIEADDVLFADEARLLVLDHDRTGSIVRLVDLEQSGQSVWSHHLDVSGTRLSFNAVSRSWRVVGWGNDDEDLVSIAGTLGSDGITEVRWKTPTLRDSYMQALAVEDRDLLALETTYARPVLSQTTLARLTSWMPRRRASYRLWLLGQDAVPFGESHLVVNCPAGSSDREPPVCAAYDGSRTGFFTIDPALRQTTALATVEGRSYVYDDAGDGWMAGWWDGSPVLIRAARREAIRVVPRSGDRPYALGIGQTVLAAATTREHGARVRLYSLR